MNTDLKKFADELSPKEKDDLYRILWSDYVRDDIIGHCKDNDIEISDAEIEIAVQRYVYDGEYDCNLTYWDNIDNLVRAATGT